MRASSTPLPVVLTLREIMLDLESGRSQPLRPTDRLLSLRARRRPTLGGPTFLRSYVTARALGRIHPRLARRSLLRLWLTPWVHRASRRPATGLANDTRPWSLHHDGRTLSGFTGGAGPTAVLVHGWAGRAADWRHIAQGLITAGWRVVAPDLPAHGTTDGRTTDAFELARAAGAVLRHERPDAVVAHSMGFPIVLLAFEDGVDAPETLVALAPGRRMIRALDRFGDQARLRPALVDELRRANQRRFGQDVWEVLDVDRSLPDLAPTGLIVHDADDADVPIADGRDIADRWPGAAFVATHGLGHRRILRDPHVRELVVDALS
ncbi:MAG TPA: alpha/beta fold hydrolase [Euzebyales bacterium]|nr:alpha/beta fold hydrolase [Euzebyales bacterium]